MSFTLHSELRAYLSYGHPPRRRCPDKGGLSVVEFHTFYICNFRVFETLGENLAYDMLATSSQRTGFRAGMTEND